MRLAVCNNGREDTARLSYTIWMVGVWEGLLIARLGEGKCYLFEVVCTNWMLIVIMCLGVLRSLLHAMCVCGFVGHYSVM